ncbi:MAG: hypothetical protein E7516_06035 [Ruminococcaceae bacterium]|nr:hypothetical protein [Oscillospiraceae bacterium]
MGIISLQMIDHSVSSLWWKSLVKHFIQAGDAFEIRCWKEELDEIRQASLYGNPTEDRNEVSVKGIVSAKLLAELLSDEPSDKSIYNKMTKYFTINVENERCFFCSAHYGTEMYLERVSDDDILFFESVINQYDDCFSVSIDK